MTEETAAATENEPKLQPDISDVIQEEEEYEVPVTKVEVCGPARVQQLPRKGGGTKTVALTTSWKRVLTADHRRSVAHLVSATEAFRVAFSKASTQDDSTAARIPSGILFPVGATVEVWVKADQNTTDLSVIQERWAEG